MNKETLTALHASIKHWKANAEAQLSDVSISSTDCALCNMFIVYGCHGCPIAKHTEQRICKGTPHANAAIALSEWYDDPDSQACREAFQSAALAEVEFLKSLRPSWRNKISNLGTKLFENFS